MDAQMYQHIYVHMYEIKLTEFGEKEKHLQQM